MRAESLVLTRPRRLEWLTEELPDLAAGEALVQTIAGAISIGTELPLYRGDARHSQPPRYPRMTGYESLGRVLAVGPDVPASRVSGRVLAFYGHRTHAVVPAVKLIPVPDDVPDALALTAILSCDAAKGIRKLAVESHERVLVMGAGTMGLLAIFVLHSLGVREVDVVEPAAERRARARRLGARYATWPEAGEREYDAGIKCSARDAAFALLHEKVRKGGRICVLSDGNLEPMTLTPIFHEKELTIVASSDGEDYQAHARWYFEQTRRCQDTPALLFDHEIPHTDLPATFQRLADATIRPMKVLVRYTR